MEDVFTTRMGGESVHKATSDCLADDQVNLLAERNKIQTQAEETTVKWTNIDDDESGWAANVITNAQTRNNDSNTARDRSGAVRVVSETIVAEITEQVKDLVLEELKDTRQNRWARNTRQATGNETRKRKTSPEPYEDTTWGRSQSPLGSLYSDSGMISPGIVTEEDWLQTHSFVYDEESEKQRVESLQKESEDAQEKSKMWREQQESKYLSQEDAIRKLPAYRYLPISSSEIRLLRIDPGNFYDPLHCALKNIAVTRIRSHVLTFQALSYAWGKVGTEHVILVSNIHQSTTDSDSTQATKPTTEDFERFSFPVQRNLFQALRRIRQPNKHLWLWVDALCIDQHDEIDKSQQIPNMPEIYSNAWNVIVWLGEGGESQGAENDLQRAMDLIPKILNLRMLDELLNTDCASEEILLSWLSFGQLLQSPWFSRRWVIQEIACARQLSIRIRHHIVSWIDFTDTIDIYIHNLGRIQKVLWQSSLILPHPLPPSSAECSRAMALLEVSSNCFQKTSDLRIKTKLLSLETLVLAASSFAVSEIRDTIYALLYLANDREVILRSSGLLGTYGSTLNSDYSRHAVDIYIDFVMYCINKSSSLDIIYQPWAIWPHSTRAKTHNDRCIPSWIGVASFGDNKASQRLAQSQNLNGILKHRLYSASRGTTSQATTTTIENLPVLLVKGVILGTVYETSMLIHSGTITSEALRILGWNGSLENGVADRVWRTLAANRTPEGIRAPAWYRRACALALTKLDSLGNLEIPGLISSKSEASVMVNYLQRVQTVVERRKTFRCSPVQEESHPNYPSHDDDGANVGIGPHNVKATDVVCILFGCSVPVVLRRVPHDLEAMQSFRLIGTCYVHGHMEGEGFVGISESEIEDRSMEFRIY
jgi:hypothetical protein